MHWDSVGEFLAMGGYALYVWGSFGACALALLFEPWLVRRRHDHIAASLRAQYRARDAGGASGGEGRT